ncbi:hypothetical protein [Variovorax paradoxus]|jgi:hypothetical protein|uniref:hypothetical protein n=1 Tax=Variovorax paradoxus TaxID=34073 RepID=UPI0029C6014B|nr:hypothetical protein [Variovorax paradoxus]WPH22741.1 hypothetical protein RZE78_11425 [Variovorax paradoxus]
MKQEKEVSMNKNFKAVVTLALTAAMLAGCAAAPYRLPGTETQPLSSLAIVKSGPRAATYLASIDGEQVPHVLRPVVRWELSPGEHAVVVGLRTHPQFRADPTSLKFVALPGRTYVIQYEVKASWGRGTWRGWIEDETGATVSVPDTDQSRR